MKRQTDAFSLVHRNLAAQWFDGLPLGNGDLGALVMADHKAINIPLAKSDLWDERCDDGTGRRRSFRIAESFAEVRSLIERRRWDEIERRFEERNQQWRGKFCLLPAGSLVLSTDRFERTGPPEGGTTNTEAEAIQRVRKAAAVGYRRIRRDHLRWWKKFWSASRVEIPEDTLLRQYHFGLYLLGSSSRRGYRMPGLQGLWSPKPEGSGWNDYTNDLNIQMNYWPIYASNHLELGWPYYDTVRAWLPETRRFTRQYGGCRGVQFSCCASPEGIAPPGYVTTIHWAAHAAFVAQNFWSHWHPGMLTPVYPCADVTGKLAERSIDRFIAKGRWLWCGFSPVWVAAACARVGRGKQARDLLRRWERSPRKSLAARAQVDRPRPTDRCGRPTTGGDLGQRTERVVPTHPMRIFLSRQVDGVGRLGAADSRRTHFRCAGGVRRVAD